MHMCTFPRAIPRASNIDAFDSDAHGTLSVCIRHTAVSWVKVAHNVVKRSQFGLGNKNTYFRKKIMALVRISLFVMYVTCNITRSN